MRFATRLAGVFWIAIAVGCARSYPPDPEHDVDIAAPDGIVLKGSYFSPGKPGPGVLLIHQCNMDRHAWDSLTPQLTRVGIHVLTFDQRGFGATGGKGDQQKAVGDADTANAYLLSKKDVDKTRVAAGGASCGVTFSSEAAARHREITALLLLSGWTTDASRAYFAATPSLAIFGAAADAGSDTADIRQAVAASKNPTSMLKTYRGSTHGVAMFGAHPDLEPASVEWLRARLR
jgi:pimeloyl-ACP methyl ester carboxylesterase